ncbi:argininosuccinate synthase domain-containing protein [Solihabitans fulvus]|nr:argininosuccinate synthase domain-containing protein [Solihabitans fulvus]
MLVSGGLSCVAVAAWLAECGVDVTCFVADLGQSAPLPPAELVTLLGRQGLKAKLVDLRREMAELYVDVLRYQASYEGGYWNTTGASRAVLVAGLADTLRASGCTVLAHACVGGGNDQARFARYGAAIAPDLRVFTPWTSRFMLDRFQNRADMSRYLTEIGYPAEIADYATYSIDGNLGGFSHESDELEGLGTSAQAVRPLMTAWPQRAPDLVEDFEVRFERGRPVAVNGRPVSALEAVLAANDAGGRNGLSIQTVVENRVNGTKCRGTYEAPGLELLGRCLTALYQVSLDKAATELMRTLSVRLGRAVYEGRLRETDTVAAASAADTLTATATGTVQVGLYKGNVIFQGLTDLVDTPGTARQTRFSNGGHAWHVLPV